MYMKLYSGSARKIATVAAFAAAEGHAHPRVIELPNTGEGLGFNVMGGKEQNCPVYVSRIIPDGVAAKQGGLKRGDQLLWVNGTPVDGESHDRVVELLKCPRCVAIATDTRITNCFIALSIISIQI